MTTQALSGRCLCEGVAYEITGELGPIYNCHCSKCRRWHGAAFRTRASLHASQFRWVHGTELISRFHSSQNVVKHFCKICGSNLISTYDDHPERIGLPLGGLDQAPSNRPEGHIWVGSKSPWYEITDNLPQYDTWPGSEDKVLKPPDVTMKDDSPSAWQDGPVTRFYAKTVFFVRDASRSLAFYTKELGFSLDWIYEENGKPHVFQVSLRGFELILNQTEPATAERPGHGRTFIGLDEEGSAALKQHIESKGIKITHVQWGAPTIAIYDPDQNEVFFWLAGAK